MVFKVWKIKVVAKLTLNLIQVRKVGSDIIIIEIDNSTHALLTIFSQIKEYLLINLLRSRCKQTFALRS